MGSVLVTGGAGFIGSHIVDELVALGWEVKVLDHLDPAAHRGKPDYLNPDAEYVFDRVGDLQAWRRLLPAADAICHQAAKVGLGVDFADVAAYVHANDAGTAAMLWAMNEAGFRGRLVLASSMVVYGEGSYRCAVDGVVRPAPRPPERLDAGRFEPSCPLCGRDLRPEPVPEDAPVDPRNVYAATKLHQEHLCAAFARETGIPYVALRYHNVYGPRLPQDTPYAGVASIFLSSLAAGRAPEVFEDGRQMRDFIHVRDVAHANVLALAADPPVSGVFNVATGRPRSVGDMADALADAAGPDAPRPVVTGGYRLGDVRHVFASAEHAATTLGFRAQVGFDDGMRELATAPLREPPRR